MVHCFDLTKEATGALDSLMETGQFQDVSEATSMALVNYQVIHKAVSKSPPGALKKSVATDPAKRSLTAKIASSPAALALKIPELFARQGDNLDGLNLTEVLDAAPTEVPPARWLFGQYNKFLPVKVTCRGLMNMLRNSPGGVPLDEATREISTEAWVLGDYLHQLDQVSSRPREAAFAAAFPTTDSDNSAGSKIRFANQFVGDLRQPKRAENQPREIIFNGLPSALKFIVCTDAKNPVLNLTKPGAEFANLQNPVLDREAIAPDSKFSEAEVEFMLTHLRRAVSEEISAYASIIDAVSEGANTPDEVDKYLCRRFHLEVAVETKDETQITQTFLTTQRTGAIARMADLGLVARTKAGLHVTYLITHLGSCFRSEIAQRGN